MITTLIVEDDARKCAKIKAELERVLLDETPSISIANNVHDAGKALKDRHFDLMILDIHVPMRPGESPREDGGATFLTQIQSRHDFNLPSHVIGLTAYTNLLKVHAALFAEFTWALIHYDPSVDEWERRLELKVQYIVNSKAVEASRDYQHDLGIVTALDHNELETVLALDAHWHRTVIPGDDTFYHLGHFSRDHKNLSVVAASAIQVGMPAATGLAMKLCSHFKPRYLAIVGIAAGVRGGMGDILIADRTWDYGSGKSIGGRSSDGTPFGHAVFEPAPTAIPLDPELLQKFTAFVRLDHTLRGIEAGWKGARSSTALGVQIGPIASGASVLENRPLIETIKSHDRKLIGIEMETYGVFLAARICPSPRPKAMSIKSICDLGDTKKDDDWQRYAAYTSANFLYEFALSEL